MILRLKVLLTRGFYQKSNTTVVCSIIQFSSNRIKSNIIIICVEASELQVYLSIWAVLRPRSRVVDGTQHKNVTRARFFFLFGLLTSIVSQITSVLMVIEMIVGTEFQSHSRVIFVLWQNPMAFRGRSVKKIIYKQLILCANIWIVSF